MAITLINTILYVDVTIGFDQAEVTVLEGDTVSLSTSVKNNGLTIEDYFRTDLFEISTLQGIGNATGWFQHCPWSPAAFH